MLHAHFPSDIQGTEPQPLEQCSGGLKCFTTDGTSRFSHNVVEKSQLFFSKAFSFLLITIPFKSKTISSPPHPPEITFCKRGHVIKSNDVTTVLNFQSLPIKGKKKPPNPTNDLHHAIQCCLNLL